jgi:hypothetical protein
MQFSYQGRNLELQGIQQGPTVSEQEGGTFKLSKAESKGVWLQLVTTELSKKAVTPELQGPFQDLLQQFGDIV